MMNHQGPIRTVVIGFGRMGRNHLRHIIDDEDFKALGVVDVQEQAPSDWSEYTHRAPDLQYWNSRDALWSLEFDAAIIAASSDVHEELTLQLLTAGKHVLVEKPASFTVQGARRMLSAAQSQGLHLAVGLSERFNPACIAAAAALARHGRELGEWGHVAVERGGLYPSRPGPGDNVIADLAVHDFDVLRRLFGKIQIHDCQALALRNPQHWDLARLRLTLAEGLSCDLQVNWLSPQRCRKIKVYGSHGCLEADLLTKKVNIHNSLGVRQMPVDEQWPLAGQLQAFGAALRGDRATGLCQGEDFIGSVADIERSCTLAEGFSASED